MEPVCERLRLMLPFAFLLLLFLADGLKVSKDVAWRLPAGNASKKANTVAKDNSTLSFSCNSTRCNVDANKIHLLFPSSLTLLIGSSLDQNAVKDVCATAGLPVGTIPWVVTPGVEPLWIQEIQYCTVGTDTTAAVFIPGSGDPTSVPYYNLYTGTQTTAEILWMSKSYMMTAFGMEPTVIVVDSSLWDITAWWQLSGSPPPPYITPTANMQTWINHDIPQLMGWVKAVYPQSMLAFRTQPTILEDGLGQNPAMLDLMAADVRQSAAANGNMFLGKYGMIDFNMIVASSTAPLTPLYKDSIHPGPQFNLQYLEAVGSWASGQR